MRARLVTLLVVQLLCGPAAAWQPRPGLRPIRAARCRVALGASLGPPPAQTSSVSQSALNLVKNVVGTGVLTLPSGVARLSDRGASSSDALALALGLLVLFGALSGWGFVLIGETCAATEAAAAAPPPRDGAAAPRVTYAQAWTATLGARTAWVPAAASLVLCFCSAVACASVIGDTLTDLLAGALGVPYATLPRDAILVGVAAAVLLPLCLARSLAPLVVASLLGVAGTALAALVFAARLADGSYADAGEFFELIPEANRPSFVGGPPVHTATMYLPAELS